MVSVSPILRAAVAMVVMTATVMGAAPAVRAQSAATVPAPIPGDTRTPDQLRQEVAERVRVLRAWRIAEALKLDQATAARLFPLLAKYDERKVALRLEGRAIKRELRAESAAAAPNGPKLTAAVDRLLANRAKRRALEEEKVREVRKLLTPVQQAKLVLLVPRIERKYAKRLRAVAAQER